MQILKKLWRCIWQAKFSIKSMPTLRRISVNGVTYNYSTRIVWQGYESVVLMLRSAEEMDMYVATLRDINRFNETLLIHSGCALVRDGLYR